MKDGITGFYLYRKYFEEDKNAEYTMDAAFMYFESNHKISENDLPAINKEMEAHIKMAINNQEPYEIVHQKINNYYMPQCSYQDIKDGVPWELFKLQGQNKMWFTSAFTCMDLT